MAEPLAGGKIGEAAGGVALVRVMASKGSPAGGGEIASRQAVTITVVSTAEGGEIDLDFLVERAFGSGDDRT
jgi:hypothetical protein